jgi:solute:Na+ symporter, SSS family
MKPQFTVLDSTVLAAYFAGVMGVAWVSYRRGVSRTAAGFTAGGGSMAGWLVGLSIFATYVSSISFVALPGSAFGPRNWNALAFTLSLPLAAWIAVRWFVPYYRRGGQVSAYSHLERRFGPWARLYAGVCYLLTQVARIGTVMFLIALPLNILLDWDPRLVIVLLGASVTLYAMLGGIVAVIWTDAIQALVLMGGAILCLAWMLADMPEGPAQALHIAAEHGKFSLGSFGAGLSESTFWVVLIYGLAINLQNFGIDQNYVQRYIASRSDRQARRSVWLGGLLYVPVSLLFLMIGTALFAYYTAIPTALPAQYTQQESSDRILPYYILTQLPAGVRGLLVAALLAAGMSTISTSLNSGATILLADFYRRYIQPGADEHRSMLALRLGTAVMGAIGTGVALAMINVKEALDAWWTLSGIFAGGMLGLFLLGMISRRAGNAAGLAGVAVGVLVIIWMTLSPKWSGLAPGLRSPFHNYLTIVFGTAAILLVGLLAASMMPRRTPPPARQPTEAAREELHST